jgi:hypothetical protein
MGTDAARRLSCVRRVSVDYAERVRRCVLDVMVRVLSGLARGREQSAAVHVPKVAVGHL